jgi:RimK family alpha-L-glutamate ligase
MILTARPDTASNRRLVVAAETRGLECRLIDATRLVARAGNGLRLGDEDVLSPAPNAVLARVGNWRPDSLLAALEIAVAAGAATPNPPDAMRTGRDHWRTVRTLASAGLPVPATIAGADPEPLAADAVRHLGFPVVVKQRRSRMGVGVIRCSSADHLEAVLDSLWRLGDEVVVQRFIDTGGVSLRIVVVGSRVAAAARFRAADRDWRSNAARGGTAGPVVLDDDTARLAVRAAERIGLGVCGVDILPGPDGPLVVEVNPTPGFVAVEGATAAGVADAIIDHVVQLAADATPRERSLRVSAGRRARDRS